MKQKQNLFMKIRLKQLLKISLMLIFAGLSATTFAQTSVSGTVTDSKDGTPVAGVTVSVKGTKTAVKTDAAGAYTITAATNAPVLVFSSVGFTTQQVTAANGSASVKLTQSNTQLQDVVVVGYGTARKKDLSGSITTISSKDFQKGVMSTPEQLIAGKVAGVSIISNGGQPGSGSIIRIRGGSSLNASNDPLIVIDGIPLDRDGIAGASNALSFINPNDIETFTVLKDASAAAIYGSRAANGVIIITTKKGRAGELKVNFTTNLSVSSITKKVNVFSGDEIRSIVNSTGSAAQKAQLGKSNTDWQNAIYQNAVGTDNNISLTGGVKGLPYRLSLGYQYLNGVLVTDHLQKTSLGIALNPTFLNNHLKVDINVKAVAQQTRFADQGAIGGAVSFDPTQPINTSSSRYGGFYEWVDGSGKLLLNRPNNPVGLLKQTSDLQKPSRSFGNIQLDYKFPFLPDLHANLNLGYDISKNTGTKLISDSAASAYNGGGVKQIGKQTKQNTLMDFYFNYVKEIKSIRSRIDATAGYSYNNYLATNYNYRGLKYNGDTTIGSKPVDFAYNKPENTLISVFGRLQYVLADKYILTATVRRDGSSRFDKPNRWGTFPSIGLAWKVSSESFLKNCKTISDLKVRFGYGVTGQQDGIGNYSYLSTYALSTSNSGYIFGNAPIQGYGPSGFFPGLKWETTTTYNAALDYGFFNNRIFGSIDFYNKKTSDLLNSVAQPAATNFSAFVLANVGNMENKGIEFSINTQPIKKQDFTLDVNFNATYNKNTITNLTVIPDDPNYKGFLSGGAPGVNGFLQINSVGGPKNTFYLYHQVYDQNGKPIEGLVDDKNRNGIINGDDSYKGKAADPNLFFGFSSNISYKKWSAGFVLRSSFNNYVYNAVNNSLGKLNSINGQYTIGNGTKNYLETGFVGNGIDIQSHSDYYLENASFLKMDNLNLGYNFGKVYHDKATLRLSLSVQNVFTITKYTGLDPEVGNGIDNNLYPRPRTISLSAGINF
jgi:TonB-dependent starch-binding outer membrane protein SusC